MNKALQILLSAGLVAGAASVQADITALPDSLAGTRVAPAVNAGGAVEGWWQIDGALKYLSTDYQTVASTDQSAEGLALLREPNGNVLLASVLGDAQRPTLLQWDHEDQVLEFLAQTEPTHFLVEALCLQRDARGNIHLFLVDERGTAEQWWLRDGDGQPTQRKVRDRAVAPNGKACVADGAGSLFLAEEGMAIWQYAAAPEAAPGRKLVDLIPPFGRLNGGTEALAQVGQTLLAIDADGKLARLYTPDDEGWQTWPLDDGEQLSALDEPEQLHAWWNGEQLELLLRDDDTGRHHRLALSLPERFPESLLKPASNTVASAHKNSGSGRSVETQSVKAKVQTDSVARFGDAADDPAIWVHPEQPERSRVLGTDKKLGLDVFALNGERLQHLPSGRVNNVDLRYGFDWGNGTDDIAIASQRDHNTLSVYRIDAASGEVSHRAELPTGLEEIYGFCMYQSSGGGTYAIANGKSGAFEQYRLSAEKGEVSAELVRTFAVDTQPEGCVADDARGRLYVGEENHGLWTLPAAPDAGSQLTLIIETGEVLVSDLEGVSLYPEKNARYLVLSSQGDHTYILLDAEAPYKVRGKFQIVADAKRGIDGTSETDGLETTARPLGPEFPAGMLVVQDGHNVMPEAPQNFKYVSWQDIAEALNLDD